LNLRLGGANLVSHLDGQFLALAAQRIIVADHAIRALFDAADLLIAAIEVGGLVAWLGEQHAEVLAQAWFVDDPQRRLLPVQPTKSPESASNLRVAFGVSMVRTAGAACVANGMSSDKTARQVLLM